MALEHRDGQSYYYRSVRDGETVRKVYVGAGELARIAYEQELMMRVAEEGRREHDRLQQERLAALAAPVDELGEAATVLVRAHLIAAGCHRRKGEWRRERSA